MRRYRKRKGLGYKKEEEYNVLANNPIKEINGLF